MIFIFSDILGELVICTFSDVLLEIKFEAGNGLFLIGHVFYLNAFLAVNAFMPICYVVFVGAFIFLTWFLHRHRPQISKDMFARLSVYVVAPSALLIH